MTVSVPVFRSAMSRFPGAVTLLTTGSGPTLNGITATAVCSVTDSPPSLLACIDRKSGTRATIAATGRFSVQLLTGAHDDLARRFAGTTGVHGADRFAMGRWSRFRCGLPLLEGCPAVLACEVCETFEVGTHSIFIGRIEEARFAEGTGMVYAQSRFHAIVDLPRPDAPDSTGQSGSTS